MSITSRSRRRFLISVSSLGAGLLLAGPAWAQRVPAPAPASVPVPAAAGRCPALLTHTMPRLQDDAPIDLCQFSGKVVLVVNTASFCGFTKQYEGLEQLYSRYRDRGLVILGFPSNDFQQEPGSRGEIADLCFNTYGVKFPMFAKSTVAGAQANPLFAELARATGSPPRWNFHKYLVTRDGRVAGDFPSRVAPLDRPLVQAIERLLADG